jgi:hypothetical protein
MLPEPEIIDANTLILLGCRRNVETKTYGPKVEMKFSYK